MRGPARQPLYRRAWTGAAGRPGAGPGRAHPPPVASRLTLRAKAPRGKGRVALSGRLSAAKTRLRVIAIELKPSGKRRFATARTVRTHPNGTFALKLARPARRAPAPASPVTVPRGRP